MFERAGRFPHIQLKLIKEGTAAPAPSSRRSPNPTTSANFSNRQGHGTKLRSKALFIASSW